VTERGFRYGTGRSSRGDKTIRCTTCVFGMHHLHVRRPTPQMKATRMPAGCVSVVPCFLCVLNCSFVESD
jgi:hypothetical protein